MTIHCEFITVISKVATIEEKFPGGLEAFRTATGIQTFCTDGVIASHSFMGPHDSRPWAHSLEEYGFILWEGEEGIDLHFVDIAVVELGGLTLTCDWIEIEKINGVDTARLAGTSSLPISYMDSMSESEIAYLNMSLEEKSAHNEKIRISEKIESSKRAGARLIYFGLVCCGVGLAFGISNRGIYVLSFWSVAFGIFALGRRQHLKRNISFKSSNP